MTRMSLILDVPSEFENNNILLFGDKDSIGVNYMHLISGSVKFDHILCDFSA